MVEAQRPIQKTWRAPSTFEGGGVYPMSTFREGLPSKTWWGSSNHLQILLNQPESAQGHQCSARCRGWNPVPVWRLATLIYIYYIILYYIILYYIILYYIILYYIIYIYLDIFINIKPEIFECFKPSNSMKKGWEPGWLRLHASILIYARMIF